MSTTAYLIITLRHCPKIGTHAVYDVGIYSVRHPTQNLGDTLVEVMSLERETYGEAERSIVRSIAAYPPMRWILPWIDDAPTARAKRSREQACRKARKAFGE